MSCMRASLIYKYWKHSENTHTQYYSLVAFLQCVVLLWFHHSVLQFEYLKQVTVTGKMRKARERWSLRIFPRLFLWYVLHGYTIPHLNTKLLWNKCKLNKNSTRHKIKQHERKKILLCLSSFSSRRKKGEAREIEQKDDNKNVDFTFC